MRPLRSGGKHVQTISVANKTSFPMTQKPAGDDDATLFNFLRAVALQRARCDGSKHYYDHYQNHNHHHHSNYS
jgi:hypothetical protein